MAKLPMKKPSKKLITSAELVFLQMANLETITPIIEGYQKEILVKHNFRPSADALATGRCPEFILEPFDTYLLSEKDFCVYLEEVHAKHIAHGFVVEFGFCPLSTAKHELFQAKKMFVELSQELQELIDVKELTRPKFFNQYCNTTLKYVGGFVKGDNVLRLLKTI
jgi:hypothetical protein